MLKRTVLILSVIMVVASKLFATTGRKPKQIVVAQDGSGNYRTVQAAINAVADSSDTETIIYIKKGIYKEKLLLPASKRHVTLKGENKLNTILTYDDYASKKDSAGKNIGTSGSASFHLYGDNFTASDLTFENSSGPVGQAVAVWVGGDRSMFKNCRFLGFQDTLYTYGASTKQLYVDCYIEGTVDYIFGSATAWFENCELFCKKSGYVTAASTPDTVKYGYVFNKCKITGDAPAGSFALGRPWRPNAKVVFLYCQLGQHIAPTGWNNWGKAENERTAYYAEYKNTGAGYQPDKRVAWSHQLTDEEAAKYTRKNVLGNWERALKK